MSSTSLGIRELLQFLFLAGTALLVFGPILVAVAGAVFCAKNRRIGAMWGLMAFGLGYPLLLIAAAWLAGLAPGRSGIIAQGISDEGVEHMIVQTWTTLFEPYQVSLYVRLPDGTWAWHYLEHEDLAWRSGAVEFYGTEATIYRNDAFFRQIQHIYGGNPAYNMPGRLSAEEVAEEHYARFSGWLRLFQP